MQNSHTGLKTAFYCQSGSAAIYTIQAKYASQIKAVHIIYNTYECTKQSIIWTQLYQLNRCV